FCCGHRRLQRRSPGDWSAYWPSKRTLLSSRYTGPDAIAQTMSNWGDGSRAVVFGARGDEVGHFSNVVNQGGTIRFLDGQTGKPTNLSDGYTQWFILRTDR
ncbi:toxin glutamine deamidase domain-containing protein, partial [Burkholderia stagnalis]